MQGPSSREAEGRMRGSSCGARPLESHATTGGPPLLSAPSILELRIVKFTTISESSNVTTPNLKNRCVELTLKD